jgi:geranylgeranyl pyrophosphate synthase
MQLQSKYRWWFKYFIEWFKYWEWNIQSVLFLEKIFQNIDNWILIMDDILDDSNFRNGEVCLYQSKGIKFAIIESEKNIYSSLCEIQDNDLKSSILNFLNKVIKWQEIDFNLENNIYKSDEYIDKYFEMITLFTWWHVADNFSMWYQLASWNLLDNTIYKQLESVWILRQIYDDIDDYQENHHERFWDFIRSNKRLPEIIYMKNWWDRDVIMQYIQEKDMTSLYNTIFSIKNKKELNEYIKLYRNKISSNVEAFWFVDVIINKNF